MEEEPSKIIIKDYEFEVIYKYRALFKTIILRKNEVGKTSILNKVSVDRFYEKYYWTIPEVLHSYNGKINGKKYMVDVLDVGGDKYQKELEENMEEPFSLAI